MIPIQQALDGLTSFATNDVVAVMPNSVNKFVALIAVSTMRKNSEKFIKPYEKTLVSFGIMSGDGTMINEEVLKSALTETFSQMPSVTWMGFTFTASDAEKLFRRIGI